MMDLALELGFPVGMLKRVMSEREFATWLSYARVRKLPHQRIELYLAQIALLIVAVFGGSKNPKLSDFVIDFDSSNNAEQAEDDAAALFNFKPRATKHGA